MRKVLFRDLDVGIFLVGFRLVWVFWVFFKVVFW